MNRINSISHQLYPSLTYQKLNNNVQQPLVLCEKSGAVGILTLNSAGNLNALNAAMRSAIVKALTQFERDPEVKVVLLQSASPKAFCAGADIKEFVSETYTTKIAEDGFKELSIMLETMRKPMIAAVNRIAFGGGFELALACDCILCDEEANFGLPEITLGIFPGIGGTLVSKTIGKQRAMEMVLTGKRITAKEMNAWGIVNHIFKKGELKEMSLKFATDMASKSGPSLALAKSCVKFGYENGAEAGRLFERRIFDSIFGTLPGSKEGIAAFVEKRKANFTGI